MTEGQNKKRGFKKRYVFILMAILFFTVTAAFGATFYTQTDLSAMSDAVTPNGPPVFDRMVYGGFAEETLNKPMDVAQIGQLIYITDTNNKRVQVFDMTGTPAFKFGSEGDQPGQFRFPYGICGDNKGNVYVADLYNGCVSVHDSKGKFLKYLAESKPTEKTIESPGGIRLKGDKIYVTDIKRNSVMIFDLNGKKLAEIGKLGVKPGEFRAPNSLAVDSDGNLFVSDSGNQRVQVFDKSGKFIRIINGTPDGKGASVFVNPRGIGIDSKSRVYVISNLTHVIFCFDKEGEQQFSLGGYGDGVDKFSLPNGLYINDNDEIFVTDTLNQRVAVYQ